jgi:hypothetical protein
MSAEIIQFIPRPNHDREQTDFPAIAFRSVARPGDLTMDHVDTSPCEYLWPEPDEAWTSNAKNHD